MYNNVMKTNTNKHQHFTMFCTCTTDGSVFGLRNIPCWCKACFGAFRLECTVRNWKMVENSC